MVDPLTGILVSIKSSIAVAAKEGLKEAVKGAAKKSIEKVTDFSKSTIEKSVMNDQLKDSPELLELLDASNKTLQGGQILDTTAKLFEENTSLENLNTPLIETSRSSSIDSESIDISLEEIGKKEIFSEKKQELESVSQIFKQNISYEEIKLFADRLKSTNDTNSAPRFKEEKQIETFYDSNESKEIDSVINSKESEKIGVGNYSESDKVVIDDYNDEVERSSEGGRIIKIELESLKKLTPEETAEARKEFMKQKEEIIQKWEESNHCKWPTYDNDVTTKENKVIRKQGDRYDAHHLQPLGLGGKNTFENITPMHAENHYDKQGVHRHDGPYSRMVQMMKER
jgi:hypothetical protein